MSNRQCREVAVETAPPEDVLRKGNARGSEAVRQQAPEFGNGSALLCIDECWENLQLRRVELERLGFAVRTATSWSAALDALKEENILAVLLVYRLEGLDVEAIAFETKVRFPDVPILLLAQPEMPDRILWLVDGYLLRSESLERIIYVLSRLAECKRQSQHSPAK